MARLDRLTGKTTVLYANTAGLTGGKWSQRDMDRPVWRAFPILKGTGYATSFNLPPLPGAWTRLVMDQYSFHGRLPGYGGDLDLNVYYGGLPQWGAVGSASTKKDWLSMATEADLRRVIREEIARNNAVAAKTVLTTRVQNQGAHPVTGEPLTGFTTLENELKHAYLHALRRRTVFDTVKAIADAVRPSTLLNVLKVDKDEKELV